MLESQNNIELDMLMGINTDNILTNKIKSLLLLLNIFVF
jgi:hypothetical protein